MTLSKHKTAIPDESEDPGFELIPYWKRNKI